MKNFRNNFRRSRYKNYQDRNNHKNENGIKMISDITNGSIMDRKNTGRTETNIDIFDWIKEVQDLGVGEIILTSINNDLTLFKVSDPPFIIICSIPSTSILI